jgi:hypothetical protein
MWYWNKYLSSNVIENQTRNFQTGIPSGNTERWAGMIRLPITCLCTSAYPCSLSLSLLLYTECTASNSTAILHRVHLMNLKRWESNYLYSNAFLIVLFSVQAGSQRPFKFPLQISFEYLVTFSFHICICMSVSLIGRGLLSQWSNRIMYTTVCLKSMSFVMLKFVQNEKKPMHTKSVE